MRELLASAVYRASAAVSSRVLSEARLRDRKLASRAPKNGLMSPVMSGSFENQTCNRSLNRGYDAVMTKYRHSVFVLMLFTDRNHAAMRHFTDNMLKLDSRVVDLKLLMQSFLHIAQNPLAD